MGWYKNLINFLFIITLINELFDPLIKIKRKNYLRDNSVIFFRVLIEKKDCDLDVGLKLSFGVEAKILSLFDF